MRYAKTLMTAALSLTLAAAAVALPMKVRTLGTKSQNVIMCADCKSKVSCAMVGDYLVGLSVDLESAKTGTGRLIAHVQNKDKSPVTDAKVTAAVSMPEHKNAGKTITLKHDAHGKYLGNTNVLNHAGAYKVEVAVTPAGGDTIKQVFTFTK